MKGFVRPEAIVLASNAEVPERNLLSPPPNQFTHGLTRSQPFYFQEFQQASPPDGELSAGAKVVLLVYDGGDTCRVADERGLYVATAYGGLKKL